MHDFGFNHHSSWRPLGFRKPGTNLVSCVSFLTHMWSLWIVFYFGWQLIINLSETVSHRVTAVPRQWNWWQFSDFCCWQTLWVLSSPQGRAIISCFYGWTDSCMVFIFSCYVCKLLAGYFQSFLWPLESTELEKKSKSCHLLWDSLLSLTWLYVCDYWERICDFKGRILPSCSISWALLFISFSVSLKKGLL